MYLYKIPWFNEQHEMLNSSDELKNLPAFSNYLDEISSGKQPINEDMTMLIENVLPILYKKIDDGEIYVDKTFIHQMLTIPAMVFPFSLFPWETFVICFMVGFRWSADDILVFDEYFLYMARGAGKNGLMSWVIFGLLSKFHAIPHYDIVVSASSERQAKTSFKDIYNVLAKADPDKRTFARTKTEIEHHVTKSNFQFLSSNGATADGLRLGLSYIDEMHAIADYSMLNVLGSALGKIPDARSVITSTNGYVRGSVLDDYIETGKEVLKGNLGIQFPRDDEHHSSLFPFMHHIDDVSEVKELVGWQKSNPSLIYMPTLLTQYRKEVRKIDTNAELNIEFHLKRVNYPKEDNRFSLATSEELANTVHKSINDYVNETGDTTVWGVVDYSETTDMTSCGVIGVDTLNDVWYYEQQSYITSHVENAGIINPEILRLGHEQGRLNTVYTKMIDPSVVVNHFTVIAQKYFLKVIYIDQFKSTLLKPALEQAGFIVKVIRTDMKAETQISSVVDKLFSQNRIYTGDDAMFRWAVKNLYKQVLSKGIRYDKIEPKSRKTDPASAFLTGLIGMVIEDSAIEQPASTFAGHMIT